MGDTDWEILALRNQKLQKGKREKKKEKEVIFRVILTFRLKEINSFKNRELIMNT